MLLIFMRPLRSLRPNDTCCGASRRARPTPASGSRCGLELPAFGGTRVMAREDGIDGR